ARQFVASRAETYRTLASRLIESGRLIEAERVMALLKEDEASTWTRSASAAAVPLTTAETELEQRYRAAADHVMALGREHAELAQKASHTDAEKARLDELRKRLAAANEAFIAFLDTLSRGDQLATHRTLESLREDAGIGPDLSDLGPGHVAVYTLVGKDALHLIVVSPDAQSGHSVRLESGVLDALVASLREALMDPESDPKPIARELYELILAPIEKDLVAAKAKTILWSLDRTLRHLPIAALWDGKRWAIERWSHSVFTPASHARLKDQPGVWRVLGLGVTRGHPPFSPLPAVGAELDAIIGAAKDKLPGVVALDSDFTKERLVTELGRRYPVVHLASHFAFAPGDKNNSFLLLGDGSKLTVSELERLPNLFAGVDLLTLSACNTATGDLPGDGQEVESFAVLAQRKGARAVFATLWPVADQSTGWLMSRFYRQRKVPKVLALREAQLDMIRGKADPKWRHPYHWAPFVVIGNTR
ncbi:MAG TPA: CHAT domain-containing protein, partial [Myxococcota bacterium]|nr:CHAT domain-containing protein [Myxococcota bacterium]